MMCGFKPLLAELNQRLPPEVHAIDEGVTSEASEIDANLGRLDEYDLSDHPTKIKAIGGIVVLLAILLTFLYGFLIVIDHLWYPYVQVARRLFLP